jgi:hypothetical protein
MAFVNDVKADLHDADTVYVALDDHKTGDYKPYLVKSMDRGKTWESIAGDLPDRHLVWRVIQDHVNPKLLFAATEFGIFFTINGGENWIKLSGTPTIPFRDLEIQRRENDLVGASFGRSFYVFDDYTPLRTVSNKTLKQAFTLFPVRKSLLYVPSSPLGGGKGSQGDSFYTASNPPFGAVFTYHVKESPKTKRQQRAEREGKVKKSGGDVTPPDWDDLRDEEREEGPVLQFTITDTDGNVVNRVTGSTSAGFHRTAWNLRYASPTGRGSGPLVAPGTYWVRAAQRAGEEWTPFEGEQEFEVVAIGTSTLPEVDREETLAFQNEVGELQRALIAADGTLNELLERVRAIKGVVRGSARLSDDVYDAARQIELSLLDVQVQLRGDDTRDERSQESVPSILSRAQVALSGTLGQTYGPTKTFREQYQIAKTEFSAVRKTLQKLLKTKLVPLEKQLDEAGAPWTPGRPIPQID